MHRCIAAAVAVFAVAAFALKYSEVAGALAEPLLLLVMGTLFLLVAKLFAAPAHESTAPRLVERRV